MTDETAQTLGSILWLVIILFGFAKKLRDDKTIIILVIVTGLISIYPVFLKIQGLPFSGRFRGSDFLFAPFIYITTYGLLRLLYKNIYKREPTYNRTSMYDPDDNRKQNTLDIIVYVLPLGLSIFFVMFLGTIWP